MITKTRSPSKKRRSVLKRGAKLAAVGLGAYGTYRFGRPAARVFRNTLSNELTYASRSTLRAPKEVAKILNKATGRAINRGIDDISEFSGRVVKLAGNNVVERARRRAHGFLDRHNVTKAIANVGERTSRYAHSKLRVVFPKYFEQRWKKAPFEASLGRELRNYERASGAGVSNYENLTHYGVRPSPKMGEYSIAGKPPANRMHRQSNRYRQVDTEFADAFETGRTSRVMRETLMDRQMAGSRLFQNKARKIAKRVARGEKVPNRDLLFLQRMVDMGINF